jgi:hypothetical protein
VLVGALAAVAMLVAPGGAIEAQVDLMRCATRPFTVGESSLVARDDVIHPLPPAGRPAGRPAGGVALIAPAPGCGQVSTRMDGGPSWREEGARPAPWWSPVASLVLPGAGQFALRQQRSVGYLVAEGYLLLQALTAYRDGNRDRAEYRNIARNVARAPFGGDLPTGSWDYYEAMEYFLESGVFNRSPGGPLVPEIDEQTFNGAQWRLARETFWRDPEVPPAIDSREYQRAIAFYESRAVRDEFRWSWRDAQLQQELYRQTIASANRSYQRAVNMVGMVGANHLLSMVDAYVAVRIRRYGGAGLVGDRAPTLRTVVQMRGDPAEGQLAIGAMVRWPITGLGGR